MRSSVYLILMLCALGLAGCGDAEVLPPEPAKETESRKEAGKEAAGIRVLFLGDSITAGLHLEGGTEEAFPYLTQQILAEDGIDIEAINAGQSGDTSAGGLSRLAWVLRTEPQLVVIELGGNDALRGQRIEDIRKNLGAIIDRCHEAGVPVFLMGMLLPPSYGPFADEYRKIYVDLAAEKDIEFLPEFMAGVGGVPELNFKDLLHPNREGHRKLARKLAPALKEVLQRKNIQPRPEGSRSQ